MIVTFYRRAFCIITVIVSLCTTLNAQNDYKGLEWYLQDDQKNENNISVYAGLSMNSYTGGDTDDASMKVGFNVGISGKCYLTENFFGELSIGFATKGAKESEENYWEGNGYEFTLSTYNLDVPLYFGYRFCINDNSSLSLKLGPYITYAFAGKLKYEDDYGDKKSIGIGEFVDFNRLGAGIGCGVGYNYDKIGVTAIYQRGLTKLVKEQDIFEQNISLSLSYTF